MTTELASAELASRGSAKRSLDEVDKELLDFTANTEAIRKEELRQAPKKRKRAYEAMTQYSKITQSTDEDVPDEPVPGYIQKVKLRNFMSHENFELELGPQLNFIVGNNGSGKSAILTAITIGLGGKTSDTNRGTKLTDLIREGTASAKITLHLDNSGMGSYEHEKFGDTIIIERTIRRDSSNVFSVKTENGTEVGSKKKDVQVIIDFFSIPISNPMCFLSQDAARRFLTASTSQDKYHHFMKGTLLEDTFLNLKEANSIISNTQENMRLRMESLMNLKQEYKDARKLARQFNQTTNLNERKMLLYAKVLSLDIEANTKSSQHLTSGIEEDEKSIKKCVEKIKSRENDISRFTTDQTLTEQKIEEQMLIISQKEGEFRMKSEDVKEYRNKFNIEDGNIKEAGRNIADCKDKIRHLSKKIAMFENKLSEEMGGDRDDMKQQLKQLEIDIQDDRNNIDVFTTTSRDLRSNEDAICNQRRTELAGLEENIRSKSIEFAKVKTGNNNFLFNFDRNINRLLDEINRARNQFSTMPIGPLGKYVSVKSEYNQWTRNIQKFLSSTVSSIVVSNLNDDRLLRNLMRKCGIRNIGVLIYKIKKFDTSSFLIRSQFPTVYDALTFDTPEVECLFIDVTFLEKVVLVEDYKSARQFLRGNPGKIRLALSLRDHNSGYQLRGANQLDSVTYDSQIKMKVGSSNEDNLAYLIQSINEDKSEMERIKGNYETLLHGKRAEIRKAEENIKSLAKDLKIKNDQITQLSIKVNAVVDTGLLTSMNEEKQNQEKAIVVYENSIKELQSRLDKITEEVVPVKEIYDAAKKDLREANNILDELKTSINRRTDKLEKYKADIKKYGYQKEKYSDRIASLRQNNELLLEGIEKQRLNLQQVCSIEKLESENLPNDKDELKQEMDKINRDIKRAENSIGVSQERVVELFNESRTKYKEAHRKLTIIETTLEKLHESVKTRVFNYKSNLNETCLSATLDFISSLKLRKLTGKLVFIKDQRSLEIYVSTPGDATERSVDTLSGGEKSYSQMALLLATWKPMRSRIIALDEFDVYMDQVNRKVGTGLIVNKLKDNLRTQTIIITPQDIGKITDINDTSVRIHKIKDPKRQNNSDNTTN
ncbi:similar to Saccharomyces cerevisiae YLR383W SMC6 Protein involved in structural maintenance of chromosomes [Maudiozyma barnettii]|uniref:Similar to Saccharomyces cerevisiae YLR383W SMC6 Protein involved in structural maintenance of chromosomes n=1 Tax=Maudiozyma barnettii TaxID=61262 RepID=A0A8H2ZKS6_9SACH|nr:DNA repair protein SMC6 [Kazachstania barnettii]CAB4257268.1 similar to Saccharomyces cerevisiae YLR383W SMC6 Protein involved in structural maintenance of chromosomes [Kazachstania barnettii]CAD1784533.1 similar to Saccharomyces cerevisiae YLR383W SMC6 Protein involved in structural maintenance of chromosomes [Kazachstania barnettii]